LDATDASADMIHVSTQADLSAQRRRSWSGAGDKAASRCLNFYDGAHPVART
jgi:hypothetical protein